MKEESNMSQLECHNRSQLQFSLDSTLPFREPWFYNMKNMTKEIKTMKLANSFNENAKNLIRDNHSSMIQTQYPSESTCYNHKKLSINIVKRLLPKSIRLPFLQNNMNETMKYPHIPTLTSPKIKSQSIASDNYQYRQIFQNKRLFTERKIYINNKLNINYAETEAQYEERLSKLNHKLKAKGERIKHDNKTDHLTEKLKDARDKILFMKGVMDYSYPTYVVRKIKEIDKYLNRELNITMENNKHYTPYEQRNHNKIEKNERRLMYLSQAIDIKH